MTITGDMENIEPTTNMLSYREIVKALNQGATTGDMGSLYQSPANINSEIPALNGLKSLAHTTLVEEQDIWETSYRQNLVNEYGVEAFNYYVQLKQYIFNFLKFKSPLLHEGYSDIKQRLGNDPINSWIANVAFGVSIDVNDKANYYELMKYKDIMYPNTIVALETYLLSIPFDINQLQKEENGITLTPEGEVMIIACVFAQIEYGRYLQACYTHAYDLYWLNSECEKGDEIDPRAWLESQIADPSKEEYSVEEMLYVLRIGRQI